MTKKKRSAKQLANDKRLGRMAKARAKAARKKNPHGGTLRKRQTAIQRARNPKRTTRAKTHLWRVFKCKGNDVRYMGFMTSGKLRWFTTRGDATLFQTRKQAKFAAEGVQHLQGKSVAGWNVGAADYDMTSAQIVAGCKPGK